MSLISCVEKLQDMNVLNKIQGESKMGNKIFQEILNGKIENFVMDYSTNSKNIFVNDNDKLIHPR